jgi:flavorubredoxin
MDSVDIHFTEEWLNNIKTALNGKAPDYLIVQHMEPDHSANIDNFLRAYPEATVVASKMAFDMMNAFFGTAYEGRRIIVGEGDTLAMIG